MKSIALVLIGLLLGVGVMLLVPHGTPQVVYAKGTPSGNGDVNASGAIDIAGAVYLLSSLFAKGPAPEPIESTGGGLPATGQTKCYDFARNEIDCGRADFPGQDGFYQKGCPTADRFVENQDGTVTDTCTGLMWQKETAPGGWTHTWQQALQYCENLQLAGHGDWRLPNVVELQSIVDYGRSDPSVDPIFGAEPGFCWSSSTYDGNVDNAWFVNFSLGGVGDDSKGHGIYKVRAVRG
jgi:hypothetical protein